MIKFKDKWLRIAGIGIFAFVLLYFNLFMKRVFDWTSARNILIGVVSLFVIWEGNRFILLYSKNHLKGRYSTLKKLFLIIPCGILFTATVLLSADLADHWFERGEFKLVRNEGTNIYVNGKLINTGIWGNALLQGSLLFLLFFAVYESIYYFSLLRRSQREKEQLQKEKLLTELHSLKQQVNPHFLFNSLNSLSSLIADNPDQAEQFLDEMSKVYRYLLRNSETELISLAAELQFIRSYFHLLKTRYGDGVELQVRVDHRYDQHLIPPLTLQLLVENAVKHNKLLKEYPLIVEIFSEGNNNLLVRNNLQRKTAKVDSSNIGLKNIAAKYRLLNQPDISISDDNGYFTVSVPLIENKEAEKV